MHCGGQGPLRDTLGYRQRLCRHCERHDTWRSFRIVNERAYRSGRSVDGKPYLSKSFSLLQPRKKPLSRPSRPSLAPPTPTDLRRMVPSLCWQLLRSLPMAASARPTMILKKLEEWWGEGENIYLSISIHVYLCLSISMSIYVHLYLSLSVSIYIYLCRSMSIYIYIY